MLVLDLRASCAWVVSMLCDTQQPSFYKFNTVEGVTTIFIFGMRTESSLEMSSAMKYELFVVLVDCGFAFFPVP